MLHRTHRMVIACRAGEVANQFGLFIPQVRHWICTLLPERRWGGSQLTGVIVQLPPGGVEGVAQGDIDILVFLPIHYDFRARHGQIDVDIERLALLVMLGGLLNHHPATDEAGKTCSSFSAFSRM